MEKKIYDFTRLEEHLKSEIDSHRIAGSSLLIYKDGEVVFDKCFGYANIEKNYQITPSTRFRLASMTKPITAVAAMIAQEQGLINIEDYAYKYLPYLKDRPLRDAKDNPLEGGPYNFTIRQLLAHSAGFACCPYEETAHHKYVHDENLHTLKDFINDTKEMGVIFEPGTKMAYSGSFAYNIVAYIIEKQSGMTFEKYLKKYLFEPLGMSNTSYSYRDSEENNKAISYRSVDGELIYFDDENRGYELYYPGFNSGGAGLISTKEDYFKFALMLLNYGKYEDKCILKKESVLEMVRYIPTPNFETGGIETFGISFFVRAPKYSDWQLLPSGSFGWSGAYGTHFWVDPNNDLAVVYMHNSVTFGGAGAPQHTQLEKDLVEIFDLKR